jgi:hypothetical protein
MLPSKHSFRLLSKGKIASIGHEPQSREKDFGDAESDSKKRSFLKLAGVVGVGALATTLLPRKADALVFGSAPTATSTGVKNASGTRINPATEDTLALVQGNTSDIDTNIGTVNTNIASISSNISSINSNTANIPTKGQTTMINSMPVVIASDQPALPISGTMTFDATAKMTVDPADSLFYLRRIVKQLEPLTTVDNANRQKVFIDGSVALTVTLATTAVTTIAGQGDQMFQDVARNTYANGIRTNLAFS